MSYISLDNIPFCCYFPFETASYHIFPRDEHERLHERLGKLSKETLATEIHKRELNGKNKKKETWTKKIRVLFSDHTWSDNVAILPPPFHIKNRVPRSY